MRLFRYLPMALTLVAVLGSRVATAAPVREILSIDEDFPPSAAELI